MYSNSIRTLLFIPLAAGLAVGCGTETPEDLGSVHVKSAVINAAAGGSLEVTPSDHAGLSGTRVVVPAGALAQDTKITIGIGPTTIMDEDAAIAGPAVELGPTGTTFSSPVEVSVPVTGDVDMDLVRVYVKSASGQLEVILPFDIQHDATAGVLRFSIAHFTAFQAGRATGACRHIPCPSGSCVQGVCQAPCSPMECAPAPGAPNYTCPDGSIAGPFCERDPATATCGWNFVTCPGACTADADCATGEMCVSGTCTAGPQQCGSVTCGQGTSCCNPSCGICVAPGVACTQQLCGQGCSSDGDCVQGEVCDPATAQCVPAPGPCRRDGDCRPGETCDPMTGACSGGGSTGVACGNNTCGQGLVCCNASCGICTAPGMACTQQACAMCAADSDCDPAQSCVNGYCM